MFELLQRDAFYGLPDLLLSVFMFIIYALQAWFWLTTSAGRASPRPCSTTSRQSASRSWRMTRRPGQRSWCRYTSSVSSPGQYHHHHHHHHQPLLSWYSSSQVLLPQGPGDQQEDQHRGQAEAQGRRPDTATNTRGGLRVATDDLLLIVVN